RTGFIKQYMALSAHAQAVLPFLEGAAVQWVGVEASDATLCWLWDKKVALGSDNPTFKSVPPVLVFIVGCDKTSVRPSRVPVPRADLGCTVEFTDLEEPTASCHGQFNDSLCVRRMSA
ncbi:hypothetical protein GGX14DRAFT_353731, partial [Mycena pura]